MAKGTKTTIEFSSDASAALEALSSKMQTTKADVLRNALSLYSYVVSNLRGTSKSLAVVSEDGQAKIEKIIAVPGIMHLVAPATETGPSQRAAGMGD